MFPNLKIKQNQSGEEEMAFDSLMVFTGNANPEMAQRVAKHLDTTLGNASVKKFSDGEIAIELCVDAMCSFCSPLVHQLTII